MIVNKRLLGGDFCCLKNKPFKVDDINNLNFDIGQIDNEAKSKGGPHVYISRTLDII